MAKRDVFVERRRVADGRSGFGDWVALLIVIGVLFAIAFSWWTVGTTAKQKVSQAPPSAASPDTTVQPRTTVPQGGISSPI